MKKRRLLMLTAAVLLTIACTIMNEGIVFTDDEESQRIQTATAQAEWFESLTSGATADPKPEAAATSEPVEQMGASSESVSSGVTGDFVEYAVSAVNNGCICLVDGNLTYSLLIQGDKLVRTMPDGSVEEFEKINQDQYQKTTEGYYILVEKIDGKEVETKVDRENRFVITLTDNGFTQEMFQGDEATACCCYTFTPAK